jgi:hypothetical protein
MLIIPLPLSGPHEQAIAFFENDVLFAGDALEVGNRDGVRGHGGVGDVMPVGVGYVVEENAVGCVILRTSVRECENRRKGEGLVGFYVQSQAFHWLVNHRDEYRYNTSPSSNAPNVLFIPTLTLSPPLSPSFHASKLTQSIPLTPRLRINRNLIIMTLHASPFLRPLLPPINNLMRERDSSKSGLVQFFESLI